MKYLKIVLSLIIIILVVNCTQTRFVSFTDPDAYNKFYNRIAIIANVADLSDRLAIENKMVSTLAKSGVVALPSLTLLPPTRSYTDEDEKNIFTNSGIDGFVIIEVADAGFHFSTEPISVTTKTSKDDNKDVVGTTISGGDTEQKAFGKLRVSLIDVDTDKTMWVGDADAQSFFDTEDPDWDMTYLLKASSKKVAKELVKTGLLITK